MGRRSVVWTAGRFCCIALLAAAPVLVAGEVVGRAASAWLSSSPQPLYYGAAELHRLICQDKQAIVKRQGTFWSDTRAVDLSHYDLSHGAVVRGQYYTFEKLKGLRRILVFGASEVASATTPPEGAFPKVLERLLNDQGGHARFEVLNFGKGGVSIGPIRETQATEGFRFAHDVELLYLPVAGVVSSTTVQHRTALWMQTFYNIFYRLSWVYARLQDALGALAKADAGAGVPEEVLGPYRRALDDMIERAKTRGIDVILVKPGVDLDYISMTEWKHRAYVKAYEQVLSLLEEIAAEHRIGVIDAAEPLVFSQHPLRRTQLFYDHVHLTAEGNAELARVLAERLRALRPQWFDGAVPAQR